MNIGIVTYWYERGASYVSMAYKKALEGQNQIFIYARGGEKFARGEGNWNEHNVTWDNRYYSRVATFLNLKRFENWIIQNKIDVVFFNEQHWWPAVLLCKKMKVRAGSYVDYYTPQTVPFFKVYDFLICNTRRHYGVFQGHPQCYYIPWGTDVTLFKPRDTIKESGVTTFFHSAGYSPDRKGTDLAIRAFDRIKKTQSNLVIHSQVKLTRAFPQLEQTIEALIREKKLAVIEKTVEAPGLYYLGDVYLYPSRLDGIGLTVPEALACGLPVIASDNPPMNEFIDQGIGSLVKIESFTKRGDDYFWPECHCSVDDLSLKMLDFVKMNDRMGTIKAECRNYAVEKLNFAKNAAEIHQIFNGINLLPLDPGLEAKIHEFENNKLGFIWRHPFFLPIWYAAYLAKRILKK